MRGKIVHEFQDVAPDETVEAYRKYLVGIKGPLTTPIGKGIRSLNVALADARSVRVFRPVRWFKGVPSPVEGPLQSTWSIFRENTEDNLRRHRVESRNRTSQEDDPFLESEMKVKKIRFPKTSGVGIKPVSREGTERLVRKAIQYAVDHDKPSVTLVHKGNIMKYTEGAFRDWGYELATREFRDRIVTERESWILGNKEKNPSITVEANAREIEPGYDMAPSDMQADFKKEVETALKLWETHGDGKWKKMLRVRDSIADITLRVLTRPAEVRRLAT